VLETARGLGRTAFERACAMAAAFESAGERRGDQAADLSALADDLISGGREELSWEAVEIFRQFKRLYKEDGAPPPAAPAGALERAWLDAFADRLAAREGAGAFYRLGDGRGALLPAAKDPPPLILALDIRERAGGGQARQAAVNLHLPVDAEAVARAYPAECAWAAAAEFDERRGRVVNEERLTFRGVVLARREPAARPDDRKVAADLWAEKYASGALVHPGLDERAAQLVVRVKLARRLYPDMGFPALDADDWRLIYGEVCAGLNSQKDIERVGLPPHIERYLGPALAGFLERALPASRRLPSGRTGRFTYSETRPPELAARLGDFAGMTGTLSLCEGRLPVTFDVLAPNHRTVQKTADLASFWANTYPGVRKELKRRYPKHPWP
jgi:ATP-dependent helicase HrpB